jgi:hypothetical protein
MNVLANNYNLTSDAAPAGFSVVTFYDEEMSVFSNSSVSFPDEDPSSVLSLAGSSGWFNAYSSHTDFTVNPPTPTLANIDIVISGATDLAGNVAVVNNRPDFFNINTAVSVSQIAVNSKNIRVYPNPVSAGRDINIAFVQGASDAFISLMDVSGRIISVQRPTINGSGLATLSTSGISAGTYFLRVVEGAEQGVYKVIVE